MASSRALVALVVALLAASTGKVPLLSPPVKAVMSFVLPASLGGSGGRGFSFSNADGDDGSGIGSGGRGPRLLSIAMRNATSDYDEVSYIHFLTEQSKRKKIEASPGGCGDTEFQSFPPPKTHKRGRKNSARWR